MEKYWLKFQSHQELTLTCIINKDLPFRARILLFYSSRGPFSPCLIFCILLIIVNSVAVYFDFVNVWFQLLKKLYYIFQTMDDEVYKDV